MKIHNWVKFQHFKNRRPPWIKVYRDILDRRDISLISDRSFRVLISLWLLASEDKSGEGKLPDIPEIAFRLRMEESSIIQSIQELGSFIEHDDDTMISTRYQDGPPETETETYKEETETELNAPSKKSPTKKSEKRATRLPDDWELPDEYAQWCREKRPDLNPYKVADQFKDYWIAQPGARSRKADWFATWRNWCRNQKAENQTLSFAEREEQAKANWYAQASGRTPVYEPDIFDMAVAESRQHLRIAK